MDLARVGAERHARNLEVLLRGFDQSTELDQTPRAPQPGGGELDDGMGAACPPSRSARKIWLLLSLDQ